MSGRGETGWGGLKATAGVLLIAGVASAGDDELTLTAPVQPQAAKPAQAVVSQPANPPRPTAPPAERPVLAIPIRPPAGMARPAPRVEASPPALPDGPTLDAPIGPPPSNDLPRLTPLPGAGADLGDMPMRSVKPARPATSSTRSRSSVTSAPVLGDTLLPADPESYPMAKPGAAVAPRSSGNPGSLGSMFSPPPNSLPPQGPQRRGLFGLGRANPAPAPLPSNRSNPGNASTLDEGLDRPGEPLHTGTSGPVRGTPRTRGNSDSIRVEPRNDPAADAAVKRRVERQVREAVGNRAKDVEVRVVGRAVSIQVRGVRLFQKRNVRKSIESIPGLTAYKTTIDVLD